MENLLKKVTFMVALCMAALELHADAAVTSCSDVTTRVSPCLPYTTGAGALSAGCCSGVKALNAAASTASDRQTVCRCLKSLAGVIPGIDYNSVAGLPSKCGVNVPYVISPSTDCSKVN